MVSKINWGDHTIKAETQVVVCILIVWESHFFGEKFRWAADSLEHLFDIYSVFVEYLYI